MLMDCGGLELSLEGFKPFPDIPHIFQSLRLEFINLLDCLAMIRRLLSRHLQVDLLLFSMQTV